MAIKTISLLGSTGSIGQSALDVIASHPDSFQLVAMAAGGRADTLIEQAIRFRPQVVAIYQEHLREYVASRLAPFGIQVLAGEAGVVQVASWESCQMVLSAIVGAAGLRPTLAAIRANKDVALANKECLVSAGELFMAEVARHQSCLVPVDSEHNAIFQVWQGYAGGERLILTASGGPFRGWSSEQLAAVTPKQALCHPNWSMGNKITIDSATLMNKGLEVIEAHWLFGVPWQNIEVVVHPESIIHSMVAHPDGSVLAQMGVPDMRTPIAVALAWPLRVSTNVPTLDLTRLGKLTFLPVPDQKDFPCLHLAYQALAAGGGTTAVLNAANEVAVAAFLQERISFTAIAQVIQTTLEKVVPAKPVDIESIFEIDHQARHCAMSQVALHNP